MSGPPVEQARITRRKFIAAGIGAAAAIGVGVFALDALGAIPPGGATLAESTTSATVATAAKSSTGAGTTGAGIVGSSTSSSNTVGSGSSGLVSGSATGSSATETTTGTASSPSSASSSSGSSSLQSLGNRWVWCQPLRGTWKVSYSQSQLLGYLQQFKRIDVLHRGIDQGNNGTTPESDYFTTSSLPTVLQWIKSVKAQFPSVKIIGRMSAQMSNQPLSLDPSDKTLSTSLGSAIPQDLSNLSYQDWLANWSIRYYDYFGIDGIWLDNTSAPVHQTASNWNAVYNKVHSSVPSGWIFGCNNSASYAEGLRDSVENNVLKNDVCSMTDSNNWPSLLQMKSSDGNVNAYMTLHLDYPGNMGLFGPIGQPGHTPCLTLQQRISYLKYLEGDMLKNNFLYEWNVLSGDPGAGYDSISDGTFPTMVSLVNGL